MQHDRKLAATLAIAIEAQPKECYRNSILALSSLKGPGLYVEGLLFTCIPSFSAMGAENEGKGGLWIEHGWLVVENKLVDVTLNAEAAAGYSPIFVYDRHQIEQMMKKHRSLRMPLYLYNQESRLKMAEAHRKAWELMA